jgi:localization factor PodJL
VWQPFFTQDVGAGTLISRYRAWRIEMQPELPWNVAGIPPEAREAARAAARREGLSVGEWLTRRILRSFSDAGEAFEAARESWRGPQPSNYRAAEESPSVSSRDTQDMLARVSRSENESQDISRRIEDQLRQVARRLDATERSSSENNRAMSKAATEINIAAREQAQAFDQLGSHVMGLSERLTRVEQSSARDGMKDAVKGLHEGLSRLADQFSASARQSGAQIASVAENVDAIAGKVAEARSDAANAARALEQRIAAVEQRVKEAESGGRAAGQFNQTLDRLNSRLSTSEAQTAGAMARLEDSVAKLETRGPDPALDRRLQGIEHALSDIAGRLESTERSSFGESAIEASVKTLSQRLDTIDKRNRDAVADLRAAVEENAHPAAPAVQPPQAPMRGHAAAGIAGIPNFDLPPFPELNAGPQPAFAPPAFHQPAMAEGFMPPGYDPALNFGGEPNFGSPPPFSAEGFAPNAIPQASQPAAAAGVDSYLAAVRRQARAASADAEQGRAARSNFSWGATPQTQPARKSGRTRYFLIGAIAFIIIGAAAATLLLSHGTPSNTGIVAPPLKTANPPPANALMQPTLESNGTDSTVGDDNSVVNETGGTPPASALPAPSSPIVVKPLHVAKVPPARAPAHTNAPPQATAPAAAAPTPSATKPAAAISPTDRLAAAANTGNAKAELLLGLKYLDGDGMAVNEAEAARWLERAAKQGEAVAAYRLGTLYERGHGVPADPKKAVQWYTVAADAGNRKSMHNLAVAFAQGAGVTKNYVEAARWFSKAAALGLADSQFNLAVLYERGMGVTQSLIDAYKWYAIAAAQGDTESKARIEALATQLSADDRAAAQHAADTFHPQPMIPAANVAPTAADFDHS